MRTVNAFEARGTAGQAFRGEMAKLSASPPRGAIGAGLFLLVSLFLLATGGVPAAPGAGGGATSEVGAFLLDPSVTPVHG
jgi:hypothetical protein